MSKYKKKTHLHREYTQAELDELPRCSICGEPMDEGYCYKGGEAYYCSDKCLHHDFDPGDWDAETNWFNDSGYIKLWED